MTAISELLKGKGSEVWSVAPGATVYEAIEVMAEREVGALLVMEGDKLVGIVTERDYARKVILKGRGSRESTVGEIMTRRVTYATPGQTVDACMSMMTEGRIRHLPVMEGEAVVGMISMGDLVKSIIADQRNVIAQLEQYIAG